jgi:hypothetical protein
VSIHQKFLARTALALIVSTAAASAASATVLYDDGAPIGTLSAWGISSIEAVSDSFTLSSDATVTGVNFGVWVGAGNTALTVDWAITTAPNTYPVDGTATVTTGPSIASLSGFDNHWDSFSTGDVHLAAGTYYLVLQKATLAHIGGIFWDINNGPSTAYDSFYGPVANALFPGSNASSFQIIGTSDSPGVPEPTTWALMLGGFGVAGAALRRRRAVAI